MTEYELNQRVAEQLCRDMQFDGRRFREGQYVALLDGKVIAVADNLDDAVTAAREIEPDPKRGMIVDVYPLDRVDIIR